MFLYSFITIVSLTLITDNVNIAVTATLNDALENGESINPYKAFHKDKNNCNSASKQNIRINENISDYDTNSSDNLVFNYLFKYELKKYPSAIKNIKIIKQRYNYLRYKSRMILERFDDTVISQKYNFKIKYDLNEKFIFYLNLLVQCFRKYEPPGSISYRILFEPDKFYKRLLNIKKVISNSTMIDHEELAKFINNFLTNNKPVNHPDNKIIYPQLKAVDEVLFGIRNLVEIRKDMLKSINNCIEDFKRLYNKIYK